MPKQRSIAKSRLEALLSMATGAAAEPLAGIAGLYGLTQGGSQEAVRMIDKTRGKLTYQPRDPRGQQEIAAALGPIMQKVEAGKSWLGDKAYNASGSPALGAAAYTAPDALLAALGVRPAMAAGRAASGGVGRAVARSQSLPAPAMGSPASQLGIFAGRSAKTADHGAMQRAATRLAAGDDPRIVWREDGWMRGPDGHMRFEIDDSGAALRPDATRQLLDNAGRKQSALMQHDELYSAYPEAANLWTSRAGDGGGGYVAGEMGKSDMISLGFPKKSADMDELRSTNIHEMQHAVQEREGFAAGGNPTTASGATRDNALDYARKAYEDAHQSNGDPLLAELFAGSRSWDDLTRREQLGWLEQGRVAAYQRLAGEAESRAVEKRLNYSPQQRRDVYPLDDYDVPLDELIFRGAR